MAAPAHLPLLERAIQAVSPGWAAARARAHEAASMARARAGVAQAFASGYSSTDGTDPWMQRWFTTPRDAAGDTLRQLPTQRAQSRDLVRNQPLASSAVNTNVVRAVGTGLACSPRPHLATLGWSPEQGKEWSAKLTAEFGMWADSTSCDWHGDLNFYGLQALMLRSMLESGDCFSVLPDAPRTAAMPYALRVQLLEADRVGNPAGKVDEADVAGGIRRVNGQADAAFVYARHPGAVTFTGGDRYAGQWVQMVGRSGRRRLLHHFNKLRPEQPRGLPYLAPVMGLFKLLGTYTDAEVKAAVVSAFLTVFIEQSAAPNAAPIFAGTTPTAPGQANAQAQATGEIEMAPAAIIGLGPGEQAKPVNPARPNPAFGDFVQAVLDQLGAGTFIGSEMLLKKFSTSYTAARAAFLDAWKHLVSLRTLVASSFCQPVFETWLAEAVAIGRISAPGFFSDPLLRWAYTRAAWIGDSQGSLNPKDEGAAFEAAVNARFTTRERAAWELFGDGFAEQYDTMVAEHRQLERDGMLPEPKAGAAAPQGGSAATAPAEPGRGAGGPAQ